MLDSIYHMTLKPLLNSVFGVKTLRCFSMYAIYRPQREKTCLQGFANNKGRRPACASAQTDQCLCYSLIGKYDS